VFEARVEKELIAVRERELEICRLGDSFIL
jgi:hypothetical protein